MLGTFSFKLFNLKLQPLKAPGVKGLKANFPSLIRGIPYTADYRGSVEASVIQGRTGIQDLPFS